MTINKEKPGKSPADVKRYYEIAYSYFSGGKYEDAEGVFRLLTTLGPRQIDFWMGLGASLQMQSKHEEAVTSFGVAAILDTREVNPYPHVHAAECLFAAHEKLRAITALNSAIIIAKKDPKDHSLGEKLQLLLNRWTT